MPLLGQNFSLIKEQENIIDKLVPSFFIYINKHEWYSQDRDLEDSEMVKQARKKKDASVDMRKNSAKDVLRWSIFH